MRRCSWTSRRPAALLALLGCLAGRAVAGDDPALERLFFSPEERRALDAARTAGGEEGALPNDLLPVRAAADRRVVVNGLLRRSDGAAVAWIDGRAVEAGAAAPGLVRRECSGDHVVTLPGAVRVKPGQSWDRRTGAVSECTACGLPAAAPEPGTEATEAAPGTAATTASTATTVAAGGGSQDAP